MDPGEDNRSGAVALPDGSVRWRVWAPRARRVELVLIDGEQRRSLPMAGQERGYFVHSEPNITDGQRYAFRLDGGPERPDPASLWQPDGVHRPSAVLRPQSLSWSERGWSGIRREDLVFYEVHVGTFTPEGTFAAVIPRLDSLRELGITAVELMPVAQFPGTRNWGYDGVHLYAVQNSYGGPQALQRLVNACHEKGLAIFLDVVYNHVGPEGNYLHEFGPYFSERYRTFWGPAFNYDSAGSDAVREFILNNVRLWIGDYRLDGLRLDAVHSIYDFSPRHILRCIKEAADDAARLLDRQVHVIAESDLNDVRLLLPADRGGYGLDAQWSDDFHHMVHAYLTRERQGYYVDFGQVQDFPKLLERTFVLDGRYSRHCDRSHGAPAEGLAGDRFVISIQNHDQVGNRARGNRLGTLVSPPAQRLAASLMLLAPHLPLVFMGEEYGEERPFLFFCSFSDAQLIHDVQEGRRKEFASFAWQGEVPDPQAEETLTASRLTWSWPEGTQHAGLRHLYHDLLEARRRWPALRDFSHRAARLLPDAQQGPVLCLARGEEEKAKGSSLSPFAFRPSPFLQIYFNLTDQPQSLSGAGILEANLLFSSEARLYGGARQLSEAVEQLLPYECLVFGQATRENQT